MGESGTNLGRNLSSHRAFPLSGCFIVTLNGSESEEDRKVGLYHKGRSTYPSRIRKCVIECYELS